MSSSESEEEKLELDQLDDVEVKEEKPDIPSDDEDKYLVDGDDDDDKPMSTETGKKKVIKAGIIYLSTVPPKMNVRQVREYFTNYGPVHRSFLQPDNKQVKGSKKGRPKNQVFTEGWIEFVKRRHAKKVAALLNNAPVGGKKTKEYHDHLWNIKYLPGFQWVHLNERLAYERISKKAKLRTEISAAKREASYFARNVDLSTRLKKKGILTKSGRPTAAVAASNANAIHEDSS